MQRNAHLYLSVCHALSLSLSFSRSHTQTQRKTDTVARPAWQVRIRDRNSREHPTSRGSTGTQRCNASLGQGCGGYGVFPIAALEQSQEDPAILQARVIRVTLYYVTNMLGSILLSLKGMGIKHPTWCHYEVGSSFALSHLTPKSCCFDHRLSPFGIEEYTTPVFEAVFVACSFVGSFGFVRSSQCRVFAT